MCLTPPTEGFPWDDLRKIVPGCQWVAKVPNDVEISPKILIPRGIQCNAVKKRQSSVCIFISPEAGSQKQANEKKQAKNKYIVKKSAQYRYSDMTRAYVQGGQKNRTIFKSV